MDYQRTVIPLFVSYLKKYPILALTGPRQSGKTTFLKFQLTDYRYVNFENPDNRSFFQKDPKGFLELYNTKVIFDEAQHVPQLFSYLQDIVDNNKIMGQFIISGSQNFHLMESISQSLAGRVGIFRMYPFDFAEMKNANWLTENYASAMSRGFYPALFDRNIPSSKYFKDYIDTYLMRDVNQLKNIQDARSFKTFLRLCATRAGQLLNYNDLARDAGISHTTARSWISVLETSYIVFLLPPYFKNYSKRLIKSPKLYFYDTGLLCYLLNFKDEPPTITNSYYGSIFENMVISELIKQNEHKQLGREYFFWRDSKGHEIDLLYDVNNQLHIGEVKATKTISNKLFEGLDKFSAISTDEIKSKSLYYAGDINQVGDKYKILGWKSIE